MLRNHFRDIDEYDEYMKMQQEIKDELASFKDNCGEVKTHRRNYCVLPNFGDWRDKRYGLNVWSNNVRRRDNHTCRREGCGSKHNLHAHHIFNQADNPDLRFEIWNGITLCQQCHIEFHRIYGKNENDEYQIREFISGGRDSDVY